MAVASPWTRGNPASPLVNGTAFDHTSILKLIEWRWGLPPLTARDAPSDTVIGNLAAVLNFAQKNTRVPQLPRPTAPPPSPCSLTSVPTFRPSTEWSNLAQSGLLEGSNVKRQSPESGSYGEWAETLPDARKIAFLDGTRQARFVGKLIPTHVCRNT
jgi:hypothetical protein